MAGERRLISIKSLLENMIINAAASITGTISTTTTIAGQPISVTTFESTMQLTPIQTSVLVSNTSITVLAANPNRKWLYFRNYSGATANPIFLHFAASPATTTNGVPIVADEIYQMPEGIVYTGEVRAISSSASNKELYIEEWQ